MRRILIVVDMQNDFVSGSLGTQEAEKIVGRVEEKVKFCMGRGDEIVFTRDTHTESYLDTQEGKKLPVIHCVKGTKGWEIIPELESYVEKVFDKPTFGSTELVDYIVDRGYGEIEFIGICTDICVVSNVLLLKAHLPEAQISVDSSCCAGSTPEGQEAALMTMKICHIDVK